MNEIKAQIYHFVSANRSRISDIIDSVVNKKYEILSSIHSGFSDSPIVQNMNNMIKTSKAAMDGFFSAVRGILNDEALRFLLGGVLGGVGGGILSEVAGFSAAVGISVLGAELIAAILIVVALYLCGTAIWKKIKSVEFDWKAALKNI